MLRWQYVKFCKKRIEAQFIEEEGKVVDTFAVIETACLSTTEHTPAAGRIDWQCIVDPFSRKLPQFNRSLWGESMITILVTNLRISWFCKTGLKIGMIWGGHTQGTISGLRSRLVFGLQWNTYLFLYFSYHSTVTQIFLRKKTPSLYKKNPFLMFCLCEGSSKNQVQKQNVSTPVP